MKDNSKTTFNQFKNRISEFNKLEKLTVKFKYEDIDQQDSGLLFYI